MNALNFITLNPQSLIHQARITSPAPAIEHDDQHVVTFKTESAHIPADLRATALNIRNDLECRDLAPLLKLVVWIFQPMAQRKNILLRLEAPEIGLFAICQELRIQRVLESLLANALRHSPVNSQVTLAARVEQGKLCIWVDDQGPGVPLAEQSMLFTVEGSSFGEYVLGADDESRGLIMSHDIVAAHGGEIMMYNRPDGGAHFEFRLPSQNSRHGRNGSVTYTTSAEPGLVKIQPVVNQVA